MLHLQIQQWLNSGMDFASGLALLDQVDPDSIHVRIFRVSGSTKFNQAKLEQLLRDRMSNAEVDVDVPAVTETPQADIGFPRYDYYSLPVDLQRDHIRKGELYRKAGELRTKMIQATSDKVRGEYADLIMKHMDENQRCWERIDYFLTHGSMKKGDKSLLADLEGMDLVDLMRFKANNASNLSKWRKKLGLTADPKQKETLAEKITQHEALQIKVMDILNSSGNGQ